MREITFTLLSDGSSDRALLPIINWLVGQHQPNVLLQPQWADFSRLVNPPTMGRMDQRISQAIALYPCDWVFVHRDAERQTQQERQIEIERAWQAVSHIHTKQQVVSVIPVRMVEAWLMFDEQAIRQAASNPNGKQKLALPKPQVVEQLPDPKRVLHELLREASGLSGRRLRNLNVPRAIQLIAENSTDFAPLRNLPAFTEFEASVQALVNK